MAEARLHARTTRPGSKRPGKRQGVISIHRLTKYGTYAFDSAPFYPFECGHDHTTSQIAARNCALMALSALIDAGWARVPTLGDRYGLGRMIEVNGARMSCYGLMQCP